RRQRGQNGPRLVGMQVGHDQADGLGMLVLDKVEQLRRVGLAGEFEGPHLQRFRQAVDDFGRALRADGFLQYFPRVIDAAQVDVLLGDGHLVEFLEDVFHDPRVHVRHVGDLIRQPLDFSFAQVLEHLRRVLGTQRDEENGRLFYAGQLPTRPSALSRHRTTPPTTRPSPAERLREDSPAPAGWPAGASASAFALPRSPRVRGPPLPRPPASRGPDAGPRAGAAPAPRQPAATPPQPPRPSTRAAPLGPPRPLRPRPRLAKRQTASRPP